MQKVKSALRPFRCKKGNSFQDDSDSATAKFEELKSETALEKRVSRWLSESYPPKEPSAGSFTLQNQETLLEASQQIHCTVGALKYSEIYHPDFADWAAVVQSEDTVPEKTKPEEILQAIDTATESLSKMIGVPFCLLPR